MDHYQFLEALRRIQERAQFRKKATHTQHGSPEAAVPHDASGWHALAIARFRAGHTEDALTACQRAMACPILKLEEVGLIAQLLRELGQDPARFLESADIPGSRSDSHGTTSNPSALPWTVIASVLHNDWATVLPFLEDEFEALPSSQQRADNLSLALGKLGREARARCIQAATLARQEHWKAAAEAYSGIPLEDVLNNGFLSLMLSSLHQAGMEERALQLARTVVGLGKCDARSYHQWALILLDLGREQEALSVLRSGAVELDDWWLKLQSRLVLAPVPASLEAAKDADARVLGFIRELEHLILPVDRYDLDTLVQALEPNFYLAYRERPDLDALRRYGQFATRVISARSDFSGTPNAPVRRRGRKLRIGYVTRHALLHSVTRHFAGWFGKFDSSGFETHLFPLTLYKDWMSHYLQGQVDFQHPPMLDFETAAQAIRDAELDLIAHIAVGMDPLSYHLAAMRLAPVQCVLWGHPVSTGLPYIDYFVSAGGMEPGDGNSHYSERLVTLPGIGLTLPVPSVQADPVSRGEFDIPDHARVFVSAQSLFKYLPQYDDLYARIAHEVPEAIFLFSEGDTPAWTRTFRSRIEAGFRSTGLDPERHLRILPKGSLASYHGLLNCSDAMLDTLGWSGGQTSYDAIACDLPIVTLPGQMMRGRQTYGMLRQMGVEDTIATDVDDYVRIAVRLGKDRAWRDDITHRIHERKHLLYDDLRPVRGLEAFFRWAVGAARPGDEDLFRLWPPNPGLLLQ